MKKFQMLLKYIFILTIFFYAINVYAQEELKKAKVLSVSKVYGFLVINLGEKDGIKKGDVYKLIRYNEDVGNIKVLRVKASISACDMTNIDKDVILQPEEYIYLKPVVPVAEETKVIQPEIKKTQPEETKISTQPTEVAEEKKISKPQQRPTPVVSPPPTEVKGKMPVAKKEKRRGVFSRLKNFFKPKKEMPEYTELEQVPTTGLNIDISAGKEIIFYFLDTELKEKDFIITSFNRVNGLITAEKLMPLSFWQEVWADFSGNVEHKIVYLISLKEEENICKLSLDLKAGYKRRNKIFNLEVEPTSRIYEEAWKFMQTVKQQAEKYTTSK